MTSQDIRALLRPSEQGFFLPCWIQPRAKKTEIVGVYADSLKISLAAPPVDGKANAELVSFFSKKLKIPKQTVKITSGLTSRKKILCLSMISEAILLERLCS